VRVTIGGKRWNLEFVRIRPRTGEEFADNGNIDSPDTRQKKIRINRTLRGEKRLDTIIHEILHAADWNKDESWIEEISTDIARILTKLGYTNSGKKDE